MLCEPVAFPVMFSGADDGTKARKHYARFKEYLNMCQPQHFVCARDMPETGRNISRKSGSSC